MACREHVVDNKKESLRAFLDSQVDHQLYGGENAFLLREYLSAIEDSGFRKLMPIEPYDSPINLHPNTPETIEKKILETKIGKYLSKCLPRKIVSRIGMWALKRSKRPGRLYSFIAVK